MALAVFFTTGLLNYLFWLAGTDYSAKESLRTPYVRVLLVKVALAHVLVGLACSGSTAACRTTSRGCGC